MIAVVRAWPGQRETLVLGSGSDGRVFKYVNGTLTALYQSEAPEVVDVTFDKKGSLYVAFTSDRKEASEGATKRDKKSGSVTQGKQKRAAGAAELIKISPERTTDILWQSKQNHLHDLAWAVPNQTLLMATGPHGQVFSLDVENQEGAGVWVAVPDYDEVVRLLPDNQKGLIMATHGSSLWHADTTKVESLGIYTSSVADLEGAAQIGHVAWSPLNVPGVSVRVRTGFSSNPNEGWGGYSEAITKPQNIVVAPGRFLQVQVQVSPKGKMGKTVLDTLKINAAS